MLVKITEKPSHIQIRVHIGDKRKARFDKERTELTKVNCLGVTVLVSFAQYSILLETTLDSKALPPPTLSPTRKKKFDNVHTDSCRAKNRSTSGVELFFFALSVM